MSITNKLKEEQRAKEINKAFYKITNAISKANSTHATTCPISSLKVFFQLGLKSANLKDSENIQYPFETLFDKSDVFKEDEIKINSFEDFISKYGRNKENDMERIMKGVKKLQNLDATELEVYAFFAICNVLFGLTNMSLPNLEEIDLDSVDFLRRD